MARIIYGAMVTEIKGSVGGTTFQSNAYGYTVKNKANMIAPNTVRQENRKILFSAAAKSWAGLSAANRDAWNTWSASNPQYAKHNPSAVLSGFAVFTKWHALNFLREDDISDILVAPVQAIEPLDTPTLELRNTSGVLSLIQTWANDTDVLWALFFLSRPFNFSQNFVGTAPKFVFYGSNAGGSNTITDEYIAQFGAVPAVGEIVNVSVRLIGQENGQVFGSQEFRLTVTAPP